MLDEFLGGVGEGRAFEVARGGRRAFWVAGDKV